MGEDARHYEPGFQYLDFVRSLPIPQHNHVRSTPVFEFEPCIVDGNPYIVHSKYNTVINTF